MTLLAVPPGQQATRIKPTASPLDSPNSPASTAPESGITVNCSTTPAITARGIFATRRKSATVSVKPMPSMMMPSITGISGWPSGRIEPSVTHAKSAGENHAQPTPSTVHTANRFVILCIKFRHPSRAAYAKPRGWRQMFSFRRFPTGWAFREARLPPCRSAPACAQRASRRAGGAEHSAARSSGSRPRPWRGRSGSSSRR